jgi:parvulin-like peptidyl-prolyl isomerase
MVTERKEGERKPFEQVKEQIRASLRNQALQDQVQGHMDSLRNSANLKIDEQALARVQPPTPSPSESLPTGH